MMEGVASEAASLAAHQRLSNLCWIYDSNRVTIEGHTNIAFTEDVAARFMAYGWNITTVADANDLDAIKRAFHTFKAERDRPTIIVVHSHIGYGSPVEDSPKAHGEPFGVEGCKATKRFFGFPEDQDFYVPDGVYDHFAAGIGATGHEARDAWHSMFEKYRAEHPDLADEIDRIQRRDLPVGWEDALPTFPADEKGLASRDSSGRVLNAVAQAVPWIVGGSADLSPSTKTNLTFEGAGELPGREPGRTKPAPRRARARVGRGRERHGAHEAALVLVGLPDLLGLRPRCDPPVGADGDPRRAHLHARLDRRRRRRSDASAGRAARVAPCDAGTARLPARPTRTRSSRRGGSFSGSTTRRR